MTVEARRVVVYRDAAGEWRWRARDTNGRVVAESGEGYLSKSYALEAAGSLFPEAAIEVVEPAG